ncbi:MAG: S46 family peptidase [Alphaproteobacteria bacterium]
MKSALLAASATGVFLFGLSAGAAQADEGMWTFDNFPAAKVEAAYGVKIDQPWLDKVRAASVRLTNGCSASVVSGQGLVLTNHHCVVDCVQDLSSAETDYVQDGFLTTARDQERKCPGQQAEILTEISDVTDTIRAAGEGLTGQAFNRARDAAVAKLEQEACAADERYRCQVVSLYRGGQYKLYKYRRYADVRLVFAPEIATAFFGGDPDNFNFPRFNLDMAFLRLYEDDKVVETPQHLTWVARAPEVGEATFVSGNPGSTGRLLTVAQLETQRDLSIPVSQLQRSELRGRLIAFSEVSAENKRIATDPLFGVENSFKVFFGRQFALNDAAFMEAKRSAEAELKAKVAADPALARFARNNLRPHKKPGYAIVEVSLKTIGETPGDATSDQMDVIADLAERYGQDDIRVTHEQNLVLPHVRLDDVPEVFAQLQAAGLASANVNLISDIIACPGLDYCALANARAIPVAQQIAQTFADPDRAEAIGELKIKISGCINACGHHHVGHIGILGVDKKGEEFYQLTLGGSGAEDAAVGKMLGPALPYDKVAGAIDTLVEVYLRERREGERFLDTYRRTGVEPFKEAVYADAH